MSLIHDALKSMDGTAPQASDLAVAAQAPAPAGNSSATRGGRPAWVGGVLTFALVAGVGCAGLAYWQSQKAPKATAPSPAAIATVQSEVEVVSAPALSAEPAQSLNVAVAEVSVNTRVIPVDTPSESVPVLHALAVTVPAPQVMEQPRLAEPVVAALPRSSRRAVDSMQATDVQATAPSVDESPIELNFARFVTAMKGGHTADAQHELSALKTRLPSGSLGLMRAQAWFDLRAGNDDAAAEQYHAILERMAGDEEAAINLASILVRQGKPEDARATLASAVRLQPDSGNLRSALAQFTPNLRQ